MLGPCGPFSRRGGLNGTRGGGDHFGRLVRTLPRQPRRAVVPWPVPRPRHAVASRRHQKEDLA